MLPSSLIALYLLLASAYVSCVDETLETVHKSRLTNAVDDVNGVGDIAVDEGGDSTLRQSSLQQNTAHNTNTDLINTAVPASIVGGAGELGTAQKIASTGENVIDSTRISNRPAAVKTTKINSDVTNVKKTSGTVTNPIPAAGTMIRHRKVHRRRRIHQRTWSRSGGSSKTKDKSKSSGRSRSGLSSAERSRLRKLKRMEAQDRDGGYFGGSWGLL